MSNSSSSSFVIGNKDIATVARSMLNTVIEDWTDWNEDDEDIKADLYKGWKENLEEALKVPDVLEGNTGLNLPSTNYETYIVVKGNKIYIATANNHDFGLDNVIADGGGADDKDEPYELMNDYMFINIRNNLVHSRAKYDEKFDEKKVCKKCGFSMFSYHIKQDGTKLCRHCYTEVSSNKDNYAELKVAIQDLLSELRIDPKCLEVMANGYAPDYPGAVDVAVGEAWTNPNCKIQLSKVVAQKLINAGVNE